MTSDEQSSHSSRPANGLRTEKRMLPGQGEFRMSGQDAQKWFVDKDRYLVEI